MWSKNWSYSRIIAYISNMKIAEHLMAACIWQVLDMTENEVEMLARHLGHDAKTHKEYYRLSHHTIELSKVNIA